MRWLLLLVAVIGTAGDRSKNAAALVQPAKLPLHTKGRYIVNVDNERVKWACINWAGAYSLPAVVGGLEVQDLDKLAGRVADLGFNCVRLCYSTENHLSNPVVADRDVAANPRLKGQRFMEVFEATVKALTDKGLMVILNNHISRSGWCCNVKQDEGFWYTRGHVAPEPGGDDQSLPGQQPGGSLRYSQRAPRHSRQGYPGGELGHAHRPWPRTLEQVSALCCMDLRPVSHPIRFNIPNRLVYEAHNYIEFQIAALFSNNFISWREVGDIALYVLVALVVVDVLMLWESRSSHSSTCSS